MVKISILLTAFLLDTLVGDPYSLPHPIRWIGRLISLMEGFFRRFLPKEKKNELIGGILFSLTILCITLFLTQILLYICGKISFYLWWGISVLISSSMLAAKSLKDESMKVYYALKEKTIEDARLAVSMIVGRDTEALDADGVTRAAVETVAENTSDGVIAPLLYIALLGPLGGVLYKTVNTMDSMIGYHNEKYEYFGFFAAKMDDILNFLPARISGILMCAAAVLCHFRGKNAWRIFWRDRLNHKSPNSAHTEAACAGALGLQLGGDSFYFGKLVEKQTIGDYLRPIEAEDIPRSCFLMYMSSLLALFLSVDICIII